MGYFFSVFFGTFVLEDLALASSLALMAEHKLSFQAAFLACFLGISLGDIGLYFFGFAAYRFGFEKHFNFLKKSRVTFSRMKRSQALTYSIVISRVIPGTRLPTYIAAGFLKYPLPKFIFLTITSVFLWVLIALLGGRSLDYILMDHWILTLILFLILLQFFKTMIPKLADPWRRKALLHSWRRWLHFEFWPASFFYLPIVPYYIYLAIRRRSPFLPFYASPHLKHGGLIGESKWDLLRHLKVDEPSNLKALRVGQHLDFLETRSQLDAAGFEYPLIIKPDVGQRGFGVRIIRNDFDLTEYLLLGNFERIIQRLSTLPGEAGIFYVRKPTEKAGTIFSITDKKFPVVVGDGSTQLGDLILRDSRARIIAPVYFARLKDHLNSVPAAGEVTALSECGNHCQGAIFLNGKELISDKLTQEIDRLAKQIPDFYFGRFDIRYKNADSLKAGQYFEIVEINGSGAEATHIWDPRTTIFEAYQTLFAQWRLLFEIGDLVRQLPGLRSKIQLGSFLKDCAKVAFRKENLSVSS